MKAQKFKAGTIYEAIANGRVVGSYTAFDAEALAANPVYRGLSWREVESKSLAPIPEGVEKAKKDKTATKKAVSTDEGNIEPSPADGQNQ